MIHQAIIIEDNRRPSFIRFAGQSPTRWVMRIRFHKILSEGRSVRYETRPGEKDEILDLNIIVTKENLTRKGKF